jgi:hypothetical protein
MTIQLTKEQYLKTMLPGMVDVTEKAEAVIDIWPYVKELMDQKIVLPLVYEKELVEKVYRNQTRSFDHILLPTPDPNVFVVVIVDIDQKNISGHYLLNLNNEYGLKK